ncbi:MAG: hypothetical protein ACI311_06670 [Bacilli bacterium]
MKIESLTYQINDTLIKMGYDINLTFNKTYQNQPNSPISFLSYYDLGVVNPYCDLILDPKSKKYYIFFDNSDLLKADTDQYVIKDVLINNDYLTINSIKYGIVPDNFNYLLHYLDIEYIDYTNEVNISDYKWGIVLEIAFDFDNGNIDTIGCDFNFNIVYNGDEFMIPLNMFYSNSNRY